MKKNYKLPRMRAVEIKENDMLCSTGEANVIMNDYDTYQDTPRNSSSDVDVNWDGVGTGSDFK